MALYPTIDWSAKKNMRLSREVTSDLYDLFETLNADGSGLPKATKETESLPKATISDATLFAGSLDINGDLVVDGAMLVAGDLSARSIAIEESGFLVVGGTPELDLTQDRLVLARLTFGINLYTNASFYDHPDAALAAHVSAWGLS